MSEKQIFGFTPPNPEHGMPGYIAAHLVEAPEGAHVWITVRPHGEENPASVRLALPAIEAARLARSILSEEWMINLMVQRFLRWDLPADFCPDGGVSFARFGNEGTPHQYENRPVGTNLLTATQAKAMVEYMLGVGW